MSFLGYLFLALIIALLIAWFASEFSNRRPLRIILGILALCVLTFCTWGLNTVLTRFQYNHLYGYATKDLIKTSLHQIEEGHLDRVLKVWRGLDRQFHPTYENKANYNELVAEATERMTGKTAIQPKSPWDASVFTKETWIGYWKDDDGFFEIVIRGHHPSFSIFSVDDPPTKMHSVSISPDFLTLKFQGDRWLHTLTLKNKYEASHEWYNIANKSVWKTETMHKLTRASEEQKKITRQNGKQDNAGGSK